MISFRLRDARENSALTIRVKEIARLTIGKALHPHAPTKEMIVKEEFRMPKRSNSLQAF
jgi:hypothetical protein